MPDAVWSCHALQRTSFEVSRVVCPALFKSEQLALQQVSQHYPTYWWQGLQGRLVDVRQPP